MKTLILCYSRTNKTRYVSEILTELFNKDAQLLHIQETKPFQRYGILGYLKTGMQAVFNILPELKTPQTLTDCENIIICSPVWAFKPALPIKQFCLQNYEYITSKKIGIILTADSQTAAKIATTYFDELFKDSQILFALNFVKLTNDKNKIKTKILPILETLKKYFINTDV